MQFDFLGGPLNGESRSTGGTRFYLLPDAKDVAYRTYSDGTVGMVFGEHTYELKTWAIGHLRIERYHWLGYKKPAGSRPAGAVFHE